MWWVLLGDDAGSQIVLQDLSVIGSMAITEELSLTGLATLTGGWATSPAALNNADTVPLTSFIPSRTYLSTAPSGTTTTNQLYTPAGQGFFFECLVSSTGLGSTRACLVKVQCQGGGGSPAAVWYAFSLSPVVVEEGTQGVSSQWFQCGS